MRYISSSNELSLTGSEIMSLIDLCSDFAFNDLSLRLVLINCIEDTISSKESFDSKTKFLINLDPDVPFHYFSKNVIGRDRRCKKNG